LTITPNSGSSNGEHDTININIDTTGLTDGTYQTNIDINSNAGEETFTVYLTITTAVEQIDQIQEMNTNDFLMFGPRWGAQSFTPTANTLTKIELLIYKKGNPTQDLTVSIRNSLTGTDLTTKSLTPSQIPTTQTWIEFDFTDITVTPGNTYYILTSTAAPSISDNYVWRFGYNTPYTNGMLHFSSNSGSSWYNYIQYDFGFRTYGIV
jgi:hypothetical protein